MIEQRPLLTLTEAAKLSGRSTEAIRALIRRGRLESRRGNDGRLLVELPAEMLAEQEPGEHPGMSEQAAELREELTEARLVIARLEAERDAGKAVAAAELAAVKAELGARVELLLQIAERERGRADELAAELRDLRRPWWRRLLG